MFRKLFRRRQIASSDVDGCRDPRCNATYQRGSPGVGLAPSDWSLVQWTDRPCIWTTLSSWVWMCIGDSSPGGTLSNAPNAPWGRIPPQDRQLRPGGGPGVYRLPDELAERARVHSPGVRTAHHVLSARFSIVRWKSEIRMPATIRWRSTSRTRLVLSMPRPEIGPPRDRTRVPTARLIHHLPGRAV